MNSEFTHEITTKPYTGSGKICAVVGCHNSQRKLHLWRNSKCAMHADVLHGNCPCLLPFSLHSFPKDEGQKRLWIRAMNRKDFIPGKNAKVCSVHFLNGSPSGENSVPQLSLGYPKKVSLPRRILKSNNASMHQDKTAKTLQSLEKSVSSTTQSLPSCSIANNDASTTLPEETEIFSGFDSCGGNAVGCQSSVLMCDAQTQWEDSSLSDHTYSKSPMQVWTKPQSTQVDMPTVTLSNLSSNHSVFYTGLQLSVFMKLLGILSIHANNFPFQLPLEDQLLLVLMRLRLGLLFYDLGMRFRISTALACKIVSTWLPMMALQLKNLIFWLPRETIRATLPSSFEPLFPKTTCIIDCTEVFICRPTVLKARAQTYSDYKSHNTMKFLVCIAPNGFIMFVSKCFGGRASDKFIVTESNFLQYILPGDEIMADRGFLVEEEIAMKGGTLNMPAFTKGKKQLSEKDVTETRRVASLRIFIECAIGRIKEFRILRHPLAFGKKNRTADDVVLVCAALSNLKSPLIKTNNY